MAELHPDQIYVPPEPLLVRQRGVTGRLTRLVIVIVLLMGAAVVFLQPVPRDVDALIADLDAETVRSLTIESPDPAHTAFDNSLTITWTSRASVGPFTVLSGPMAWLQQHRPSTATYTISTLDDPATDSSAPVRAVAKAVGVSVVEVPYEGRTGGFAWSLLGIGMLAALIALIAAPQPRLATKWAWFWLAWANPLVIAFLLLEPVPLWRAAPVPARERRLTGGWAFLVSLILRPVLIAAFPWFTF